MKFYPFILFCSLIFFVGCSGGDSPEYDWSIKPADSSKSNVTATGNNSTAAPADSVIQNTPAAATSSNLNPPHGQPGHRCDIAVGAPLDSKPAVPSITQTTPVQVSPVQPVKTTEPSAAQVVDKIPEAAIPITPEKPAAEASDVQKAKEEEKKD